MCYNDEGMLSTLTHIPRRAVAVGRESTASDEHLMKMVEAAKKLADEAAQWSDQTQELFDTRYQFVRSENIQWLTLYQREKGHDKFKLIFMDPW